MHYGSWLDYCSLNESWINLEILQAFLMKILLCASYLNVLKLIKKNVNLEILYVIITEILVCVYLNVLKFIRKCYRKLRLEVKNTIILEIDKRSSIKLDV